MVTMKGVKAAVDRAIGDGSSDGGTFIAFLWHYFTCLGILIMKIQMLIFSMRLGPSRSMHGEHL
jgi:hypothetical protein